MADASDKYGPGMKPPKSKTPKRVPKRVFGDIEPEEAPFNPPENTTIIAKFTDEKGETGAFPQLELPIDITPEQLTQVLNGLMEKKEGEELPFSFFVSEREVLGRLKDVLHKGHYSTEVVLPIVYQQQALFRVSSVSRCTGSLAGHAEAVLSVSFSPDGNKLATGSGDTTVRLWDILTETPEATLKGHKNWVLCVAWSPDSSRLATGGYDNEIRLWNGTTGEAVGRPLLGHSKWITSLAWEPLHAVAVGSHPRLASSSKDTSVRVWDTSVGRLLFCLTGHTASVTCVVWGGEGLIMTGSQDRTIRVWHADGRLFRVLEGHAHWINHMALSTGFALRTGPFDHTSRVPSSPEEAKEWATQRYRAVLGGQPERLVSGSDDMTCYLWQPLSSKKPMTRMTGHQGPVNYVSYSPDARYIASASFDKACKLWDGLTGGFIANFRGHVAYVYQVCWSPDSRLMVTSSKDSTIKVWDIRTKKMKNDLPGHEDEVYSVDWSPDGARLASGSKDKTVKIWRA